MHPDKIILSGNFRKEEIRQASIENIPWQWHLLGNYA